MERPAVNIRQMQDTYGSGAYRVILKYLAFAAIVFGAKLWLISTYGSQTPFWDQWDAEAEYLYKPFLDGSLKWTDLFRPHNEHYIFTTRVLALGLLILNGIWNPLLQMVVNAGLHIIALMVLIALLSKVIGRNCLPVLLLFAAILFSIPYAWENTLGGFQSQFYFVMLFSILSIWCATTSHPLSHEWWIGLMFGILAFFSLASGVFAFAISGLLGLLAYAFRVQRTRAQLLASVILLALFVAGIVLTPKLQVHAGFRASSVAQFTESLIAALAWPSPPKFYFALLRNLPALLLVASIVRTWPPANDRKWFLVALSAWAIGQAFSIAYGRASGSLSSRYTDLYAIAIFINFACMLTLIPQRKTASNLMLGLLATIWTATVLMSFVLNPDIHTQADLTARTEYNRHQEINLRNYLATNDPAHLTDKPFLHIPYPSADRLELILRSPAIRQIMPNNVRSPLAFLSHQSEPKEAFVTPGFYSSTPARSDPTLGSYGIKGDNARGHATIQIEASPASAVIAFPVAGYPLAPGMTLEIEQKGQRKPLRIAANPKESWGIGYVHVSKGLITLNLADLNSTTWMAVGTPKLAGNFDYITNVLLSRFSAFLMLGVLIAVLIGVATMTNENRKAH